MSHPEEDTVWKLLAATQLAHSSFVCWVGNSPGAVSHPAYKSYCEAPQVLREIRRAFPNGIEGELSPFFPFEGVC
jgi:hypothetical protein